MDFAPVDPETPLTTINDLYDWMVENFCNFNSYRLDGHPTTDGYYYEKTESGYTWVARDRNIEVDRWTFHTEAELVTHIYELVRADGWAWCHIVGFMDSMDELAELKAELQQRGINFYEDSIPYGGPDDPRYRVFVHGRDAAQVADLRERFYKAPKPGGYNPWIGLFIVIAMVVSVLAAIIFVALYFLGVI